MGQLQISARFAFILSVAFRTQTHTYARTHAHTHTRISCERLQIK